MSGDRHMQSGPADTHTAALDVSFDTVAQRNGESSSRAASRSSGRKSEQIGLLWKGEMITPHDRTNGRIEPANSNNSARRRSKRHSGFLLDSAFVTPPSSIKSRPKLKGLDGTASPSDRWHGAGRLSTEASSPSSPVSNHAAFRVSRAYDTSEPPVSRPTAQSQAIDPAQLVQMALSLSESRKRHVSAPISTAPRTVRLDSPTPTPDTLRSHGENLQQLSQPKAKPTDLFARLSEDHNNVVHTFSAATISRAEKARRYFEQATEYRRLLRHVPPMGHNSTATRASANDGTATANPPIPNAGHSNNAAVEEELGRQYNPIQSLRNRQVRVRERLHLLPPDNYFPDVAAAKHWVDRVVEATQTPEFRQPDYHVNLPDPTLLPPL